MTTNNKEYRGIEPDTPCELIQTKGNIIKLKMAAKAVTAVLLSCHFFRVANKIKHITNKAEDMITSSNSFFKSMLLTMLINVVTIPMIKIKLSTAFMLFLGFIEFMMPPNKFVGYLNYIPFVGG